MRVERTATGYYKRRATAGAAVFHAAMRLEKVPPHPASNLQGGARRPGGSMLMLEGAAALRKVDELYRRFDAGMLITHSPGGETHARPMLVHHEAMPFSGDLWFIVKRGSRKTVDIQYGRPVALVLQHPGEQAYLHLCGKAELVDDADRLRAMWQPIHQAWLPGGPADPAATLLHFMVDEGECWESKGGRAVSLVGLTGALVIGHVHENAAIGRLELR